MAMNKNKNEEENGISNNNLYFSERNLYGSSRIGQEQIGEIIASSDLNLVNINTATQNIIGDKYFEMSNHLGNVLEVVSDRKLPVNDGNGNIDFFLADVVSYSDYYQEAGGNISNIEEIKETEHIQVTDLGNEIKTSEMK